MRNCLTCGHELEWHPGEVQLSNGIDKVATCEEVGSASGDYYEDKIVVVTDGKTVWEDGGPTIECCRAWTPKELPNA